MPSLAPVLGAVVAVDGERTPRGVTPLPKNHCSPPPRFRQAATTTNELRTVGAGAGYPEHER
jgi:hypothetical protein